MFSNKLESITNTYQTKRNGKIWWVVTTGSFANLNEAKQALQGLPAGVRKNKPFYKKISKKIRELAEYGIEIVEVVNTSAHIKDGNLVLY